MIAIEFEVGSQVKRRATGEVGVVLTVTTPDRVPLYYVEWNNGKKSYHYQSQLDPLQ